TKHAIDYETSKDVRATSTMTLPTTVSGIRFYLNIGLQIEFVLNRGGGTKARSSYFIRKEKYGQTAPESHSYNSL
ncbi:hypothetical protein, partial [Bacteroides heparinolyticus]|uniref:hypothetical protein n=1 Tax=Prevotella heparinolytica TaxID=28113 RepID=UPI00359FD978